MMDDADKADYFVESVLDDGIKEAMRRAADIPTGEAGECDYCGYEFNRIVGGACGKCRDKFGL